MPKYEHTQKGGIWFYVCLMFTAVPAVVLCIILFQLPDLDDMSREDKICLTIGCFSVGISIPALMWATAMLSGLTVRIDNEFIHIRFGQGVFRKKYPLNRIRSCQPIRTKWIHGWGIHMYKNGWIYNINGFDAVEAELDSGRKIAIGTDEPEKLTQAIEGAIQ
ncbi:MAG: hypothetical protein ABFR90_07380 [Planctomycetota bacterium]